MASAASSRHDPEMARVLDGPGKYGEIYDSALGRGGGSHDGHKLRVANSSRQDAYTHVHTGAVPLTGDTSGSRTTKVLPLPSSLSTEMVPP
jgi:hypothetical protein